MAFLVPTAEAAVAMEFTVKDVTNLHGLRVLFAVMLSLETLSCFKTVSRRCFDCLGLGLGSCCLGKTAESIRYIILRATVLCLY
jgi:hypothetical protein